MTDAFSYALVYAALIYSAYRVVKCNVRRVWPDKWPENVSKQVRIG